MKIPSFSPNVISPSPNMENENRSLNSSGFKKEWERHFSDSMKSGEHGDVSSNTDSIQENMSNFEKQINQLGVQDKFVSERYTQSMSNNLMTNKDTASRIRNAIQTTYPGNRVEIQNIGKVAGNSSAKAIEAQLHKQMIENMGRSAMPLVKSNSAEHKNYIVLVTDDQQIKIYLRSKDKENELQMISILKRIISDLDVSSYELIVNGKLNQSTALLAHPKMDDVIYEL